MREEKPPSKAKTFLAYVAMVGGTVVVYWMIKERGMLLGAPPPPSGAATFGSTASGGHVDALLHVLMALVVVIATARALGTLFRYFSQPPVVGEIVAGILLGPSLLGRVAPEVSAYLLPKTVAPFLQVLSQVGVILYMFLVGLELDPKLLRKRGHATIAISHASIIVPFLLGSLLALYLYPKLSSSDVPFSCFSLFMGVSLSVTAFPVLARILSDRKMHKSRLGVIALTCAAVDDVTAWCLLAFVVSVVQARMTGALVTFGFSLAYIAFMIFVVRPLMVRMSRVYGNRGRLTQGIMAAVFVLLLVSALATDLIGIHAVFGAFVFGAMIPHDSGMARELTDRLEDIVVVLLLPAFFAFTGMRTQIGLVSSAAEWGICGLILLAACIGKFGGSAVAARFTGLGWRDSAALGVLMNTRGLMELIVLNIGLELKVISPTLFAMLVLMAVITTFATTPILHLIVGNQMESEEEKTHEEADQQSAPRQGGLLLPVSNPAALASLLDLALAATRSSDPDPRVLALVRRPAGGIRSGLRELEGRHSAQSPILAAASAHASELGRTISTQAIWTDDPADDILLASRDPRIGWLLLGHHEAVFRGDPLGGVVREVLNRTERGGAHVGVVLQGYPGPFERVIAVADDSDDGRAALELAARLVSKNGGSLHAVLVPKSGGAEPEPRLQAALKLAARDAGRWLHTDVLKTRDQSEIEQKTAGNLLLVGVALATELLLTPRMAQSFVLVRGAARPELVEVPVPEAAAAGT